MPLVSSINKRPRESEVFVAEVGQSPNSLNYEQEALPREDQAKHRFVDGIGCDLRAAMQREVDSCTLPC